MKRTRDLDGFRGPSAELNLANNKTKKLGGIENTGPSIPFFRGTIQIYYFFFGGVVYLQIHIDIFKINIFR